MKKKIAIVGTNGIPASYGGYETLVENLTLHLNNKYDFTVYCSKKQKTRIKNFNGAKLKNIPLSANGWQSIIYDIITLIDASFKADVILYLGPGAGFVLPLIKIFNKNIIVNHGGLNEWEREKYSKFNRIIAKLGHKTAAKTAKINITDNNILKESIKQSFNANSVVIRYGGDHTQSLKPSDKMLVKYPFLQSEYYINVSRAQIDNNLHLVLKSFESLPDKLLIMISNWSISEYGKSLKDKYQNKYSNIILLDAIYDREEIDTLRSNSFAYIHSHSYCGTSPSLVEAMSLGLPIISFDVPTNRETTKNKALFFVDDQSLVKLIDGIDKDTVVQVGHEMREIAEKEYKWSLISNQYSELFNK